MKTVAEALNTLISAVNIAHNKGGVYNMEETHHIFMAISFLNNLSQQPAKAEVPETEAEPQEQSAPVEEVIEPTPPAQEG